MNVIITADAREMSLRAASLIADELRRRPDCLLALSTGSTPLGTYDELVRMHREEGLDFRAARLMNMDDYVGLGPEHPQSFRRFMDEHLYRRVNADASRIFGPDPTSGDPAAAAAAFDGRIAAEGGIDLILLGIGRDGHVAFNMPADAFVLPTHVQRLSEATIRDNARFFDSVDDVPTHAMTIGTESIFGSRKVVLVANGEAKAEAIHGLVDGDVVDPHVPASVLRLHPNVTVIVDEAAAARLEGRD